MRVLLSCADYTMKLYLLIIILWNDIISLDINAALVFRRYIMEKICRFCEISKNNNDLLENKPIYQNENYFSIVSVGALVEGWVLIVPKKHACSMKDNYSLESFKDFTNIILNTLQKKYGPIIAFEHGPNRMDSKTSCGTNHAHLHLVPFSSLYNDLIISGLNWEKCSTTNIANRVGDKEYLFYCDLTNKLWDNPDGWLHILDEPISQYFRRVIANRLGCIEQYDYKTNPNIEIVHKTQLELSKLF